MGDLLFWYFLADNTNTLDILLCMTTNCFELNWYIYTYIRANITCVHIWSLNFDALAQGNLYDLILVLWHRETYKRTHTKEPINHRRPSGYGTHYLQTKKYRQLPVVQHVRFMPLSHCVKTQSQWHARGCPRKFGFFSAKDLRWHDSHHGMCKTLVNLMW